MFAMRCMFICLLVQAISGEWVDDGKALFFGLPVPIKASPPNSDSPPITAMLKATFANERQDDDPLDEIILDEKSETIKPEPDSVVSVDFNGKNLSDSRQPDDYPDEEDAATFFENLLQSEETATNSRRRPFNAINLASFIRSAMALANPRPTLIQDYFIRSGGDPLRGMMALAEIFVGHLGSTIAKQAPIDFFNLMDNMQNAVDRMGGEGECKSIVELINQTIINLKELIEMTKHMQKFAEISSSVNLSTLRKCIAKSGMVQPGVTQASEKVD